MSGSIQNIISTETFIGDDGEMYYRIHKEYLLPRQTFLKGAIAGHYRGSKLFDESYKSRIFDIEIYEAIVYCEDESYFRKNVPFTFPDDFDLCSSVEKGKPFPKEKLPTTLPVILNAKGNSFGVNILEPTLYQFTIDRHHHQIEGDDVYGSFKALISGYVLDYEKTEAEEIVGPINVETTIVENEQPCAPSRIKTGNHELKGIYIRQEYFCKNHSDCRVWGDYNTRIGQKNATPETGCGGNLLGIVGMILFTIFLISIFPGFGYVLALFIGIAIINWLGPYLRWIFRAVAILLVVAFGFGIFNAITEERQGNRTAPVVTNNPEERRSVQESEKVIETITDIENNRKPEVADQSLPQSIKHFRSWNDYKGNNFSGHYEIQLNHFKQASRNKNGLQVTPQSMYAYDKIVYEIKEHDKGLYPGLLHLFDSISNTRQLDRVQFAEMVVSFVQDIPYALILDNGCDPSLYNDRFTKEYLLNNQGECIGYQRFGLNSPIEFLTTLKGDCDTRTLLLYSIFAHYNYDVAMLSSEFYGHSILGINLPLTGSFFPYQNKEYIVWETTAKNAKPGQISNNIANMNNWRISLKSTP